MKTCSQARRIVVTYTPLEKDLIRGVVDAIGDHTRWLILADFYEESGNQLKSVWCRWMFHWQKSPFYTRVDSGWSWCNVDLWQRSQKEKDESAPSNIPKSLLEKLEGGDKQYTENNNCGTLSMVHFPTPEEALESLYKVWLSEKPDKVGIYYYRQHKHWWIGHQKKTVVVGKTLYLWHDSTWNTSMRYPQIGAVQLGTQGFFREKQNCVDLVTQMYGDLVQIVGE